MSKICIEWLLVVSIEAESSSGAYPHRYPTQAVQPPECPAGQPNFAVFLLGRALPPFYRLHLVQICYTVDRTACAAADGDNQIF